MAWEFKICSIFALRFVHLHIENVIKKGGETRLCETLATLRKRRRCYILSRFRVQITETILPFPGSIFNFYFKRKNWKIRYNISHFTILN